MRYSPSTGGFYPESIDYPNLPEDLVTITDEEHQAAMNKPAGATLSIVDGKLKIILPLPIPLETQISEAKIAAKLSIDNLAATCYERYTRFQLEYEKRENQAQLYKDNNYIGEIPEQILAFSEPSGITPEQATDIILQQSTILRTALNNIAVLRMKKFEIDKLTTLELINNKKEEIHNSILRVFNSIS